jgi:predicted nuclease with TOPRIM domain
VLNELRARIVRMAEANARLREQLDLVTGERDELRRRLDALTTDTMAPLEEDLCSMCPRILQDNTMAQLTGLCDHCREVRSAIDAEGPEAGE